jgi:hypothetical protein
MLMQSLSPSLSSSVKALKLVGCRDLSTFVILGYGNKETEKLHLSCIIALSTRNYTQKANSKQKLLRQTKFKHLHRHDAVNCNRKSSASVLSAFMAIYKISFNIFNILTSTVLISYLVHYDRLAAAS